MDKDSSIDTPLTLLILKMRSFSKSRSKKMKRWRPNSYIKWRRGRMKRSLRKLEKTLRLCPVVLRKKLKSSKSQYKTLGFS